MNDASKRRALAYLRVSTDEQATSGLGMEAQAESIRVVARRMRLGLTRSFRDAGISGATAIDKRPGLLAAVDGLRRGDILLVAKRDRLGRDPIVVAMIERLVARKGARLVSAAGEGTEDDDPASVLMRRVVDAFAEYERLLIASRTRAALAAKRRAGLKTGGSIPFGYVLDGDGVSLRPDAQEQEAISMILEMSEAGATMSAIARSLNSLGVPTKAGRRWTHSHVGRVLRATRRRDGDHGQDAA